MLRYQLRGDAVGQGSQPLVVLVQGCRGGAQANPGASYLRELSAILETGTKYPIPHCQEKPRSELHSYPYRKPTLVGEEKILR